MRRIDGSQYSVRRLIPWLLGVALVFVASVATGQSGGSVNVNASGIRHTATTATGVRTAATLEATFSGSMNGVKHYSVPVPVSSGTLGNLAKGAFKRVLPGVGWYMTAKAIVDEAGWVIDELQQQVVDGPARDQDMMPPGTRMLCSKHALGCSTSATAFYGLVNADLKKDNQNFSVVSHTDDGSFVIFRLDNTGSYVYAWSQVWTNTPNHGTGHVPTPIADQQLGELLKRSPQVVNAVLIDPDTGAPIRTQELVDAMNNLRKSLEAANGLSPGTDVPPTDDVTNTEPKESAWPDFCGWATTVCEWLDWTRSEGEPHKDLPETELKIDANGWSSGVGGGACPAPETFTITIVGHQGQGAFDWQPACDFAISFKPFFITLCSIVAVFILAGLRSGAKS